MTQDERASLILEARLDAIDDPLWFRRTRIAIYIAIFAVAMWLGF